jgi:prolyl 4-hydroxylase
MNTLFRQPPQPELNSAWQDWLTENSARGCVDTDLVDVMVSNGFPAQYSAAAVSIVRSLTERVRRDAPAATSAATSAAYRADPIRLPDTPRVQAHDRELGIGMLMRGPNLATIDGLLSAEECEQLIAVSAGKLTRSRVVDRAGGDNSVSAVRTSEGTYFERGEYALIARLEARIASLTGIPESHGEPLQILHYRGGDQYKAHHDYFDPTDPGSAAHTAVGGQRVATLVIYLNDVLGGGDTVFPRIGLAVKPRGGCAVYFEYCNAGGELDERCLHAGAPVITGEKWIATKWLRQRPYEQEAS